MNSAKKILADLIVHFREKNKWSQGDLAARINKEKGYISRIETYQRGVSHKMLDKIIIALGCTHSDFLNTILITKSVQSQTLNLKL